ncbi:VOC family protein [Allorhizocola rhizosphaerae]|uniref:VOC family protein n=1 Tax=Allorhizocola rhizosphaerae TaxID=1872709 RepID=UPI000E3C584A|nr:VOC family protein [Allorhizocola rhizosphaerae]
MADNPVIHFEIPADDMIRAKAFYESVFDWDIVHYGEYGYTVINTVGEGGKEGINGGLVTRGQPWIAPGVSVRVADIDAALARIEANGGKILRPKQAIGIGFVAYFTDTEDNVGAVLQLNS